MIQIGDRQPQTPAFPDQFPPEAGKQDQPLPGPPRDKPDPVPDPLFVSPPPAPWPRVFPGL